MGGPGRKMAICGTLWYTEISSRRVDRVPCWGVETAVFGVQWGAFRLAAPPDLQVDGRRVAVKRPNDAYPDISAQRQARHAQDGDRLYRLERQRKAEESSQQLLGMVTFGAQIVLVTFPYSP